MQRTLLDDIKGHFDHYLGLDRQPPPARRRRRVREEPSSHLGNLGIRETAIGLSDGQQLAVARGAPYRERVVGQHAVPFTVSPLDGEHHDVERGKLALEFDPPFPATARDIRSVGALEHEALVAAPPRRFEEALDGCGRRARFERLPGSGSERLARQHQRRTGGAPFEQRFVQQETVAEREHVEGNVTHRNFGDQLGRRIDALQARLQVAKRKHCSIALRHDFAVEDRVAREGAQHRDDFRKRARDIVERPREEARFTAAHVCLRAHAVELVLDEPSAFGEFAIRRAEGDRGREHRGDRREVANRDLVERLRTRRDGDFADIAGGRCGAPNGRRIARGRRRDRLEHEPFA